MEFQLKKYRKEIIFLIDLSITFIVCSLLFVIVPENYTMKESGYVALLPHLVLLTGCSILPHYIFKTYDSLWRYAESLEYLFLLLGGVIGFVMFLPFDYFVFRGNISILFAMASYSISMLLMLLLRFSYRLYRKQDNKKKDNNRIPIAIIGAGNAGVRLSEEIRNDPDTLTLMKTSNTQLSKSIRDVKIEELLGREPVTFDEQQVKLFLGDKVIMVTGGGGSIGSELCRQIAMLKPKKLIILDVYENNAYDIQQELKFAYQEELDLKVEIASVRDEEKINILFERYRPNVVFHAAAHKHVPLMEDCPDEAIKNNIMGTYNVVLAADRYKVEKFVLISTDKAVNPTNIMGASKRFCEMILQSMKRISKTEFVAVRFGNVLGSNGSVIPLLKRQIEQGGPVTITDKRIIRFFMTIPEAAQLVLQAGSMANRSEVYVLDMGLPVKILELAEKLISLSGYEPYTQIPIVETGLRPGEKLYEEQLMKSEELIATDNHKIFIERQKEISPIELHDKMNILQRALEFGSSASLKKALKMVVPTYKEPEEGNSRDAVVDYHEVIEKREALIRSNVG